MDCFEGYIGILGCSAPTPESGVYINSLPGISLEVGQAIADKEQATFLNAWNDITERALRRFKTDVVNYLKAKFDLNIISEFINTGKTFDSSNITAAAVGYRGRVIKADGTFPSKLQMLYVEDGHIYLNNGIATTVYIINEYGETLWSKAITASSTGWTRFSVGQTFAGQNLWIVYDAALVNSVETTNTEAVNAYTSCYCQTVFECEGCDDCSISTTGVSATTLADLDTYTEGENSFGLSVNFGLRCSYEPLLCANRQEFIEPLVNLHGSEFCTERIYTSRVNKFTTIGLESAKSLRTELEGAYQSSLAAVLDGLSIEEYDCCVQCEPIFTYNPSTP